jgi:asparagine synthase (glutamine-hydrolysing)
MSGIVGMVNFDGAPVDRQRLRRMTEAMSYRGPDAQEVWCDGPVGLGHTMLRTTFEAQREAQPCTLDERVWIVADARVDARAELIQRLQAKGRDVAPTATDAELVLHAYQAWGEDCVRYLLGDFCFAIWDAPLRKLFCARDHFGVKLFYYARTAHGLVFSNTLNCLRAHPAISARLNEPAIGDFLLFGYNPVLSTTTFSDIQRLPPAHELTLTEGFLHVKRYWTLPVEGDTLCYPSAGDYVERFNELMRAAVKDRLRADRVGILLSGGLDSPTLAAAACELRARGEVTSEMRAYCCVYNRAPDEERRYAGAVAAALGMPIEFFALDDYPLFGNWYDSAPGDPEPYDGPLNAVNYDLLCRIAADRRVVLYGEDGDALLASASVVDMLKSESVAKVARDVSRYLWSFRRRPPFGLGFLTKAKEILGQTPRQAYPLWLDQEFAARLDLPSRWHAELNPQPEKIPPLRAAPYLRLTDPLWQTVFESIDPGVTLVPVEHRLPFLDLRVIEFALALPPLPWRVDKQLLRSAMRGVLPDEICLRPKTPLAFDPYQAPLQRPEARWIDGFKPVAELSKFVNLAKVPNLTGGGYIADRSHIHLRPLILNRWLQTLRPLGSVC